MTYFVQNVVDICNVLRQWTGSELLKAMFCSVKPENARPVPISKPAMFVRRVIILQTMYASAITQSTITDCSNKIKLQDISFLHLKSMRVLSTKATIIFKKNMKEGVSTRLTLKFTKPFKMKT